MRFVADLHVHSKYSRACSRDGDLEHLAWWGARKGITVLGTGDVTHPAWAAEIRDRLVPAEPGLFKLRDDLERDVLRTLPASCRRSVRFMLSVEISTIYKRDDRTRKVHHLLYLPDLDAMAELTRRLEKVGNLRSDGRPILGLDSRDLLETTLDSGEGSYLVPAHIWTPWFAALGSKSGFDSIADCYVDLADEVFAVETGLSSDPAMNWRVSDLDRYRLVSNSDAHSPPALGREATVLDCGLSYWDIRDALRTGDGLAGTIEFFPEEGKYHLDGHRKCEVRLDPVETRRRDGRCPACDKPLTVGVLHRVEALADRPEGARPAGAPPFRSLVQLPQIVGEIRGVGSKSKAVETEVARLVDRFGPELEILQNVPVEDLAREGSTLLGEAIGRLRRGEVDLAGGYDGEYGTVRLFHPKELADSGAAPGLFELDSATVPTPPGRQAPPAALGEVTLPQPRPSVESRPVERAAPAPEPEAATLDLGVLAGLDAEQRVAAGSADGPLLIVAGPGTGKTRTLTTRIAHLVTERNVDPERCLAVTFTRRAAGELTERLAALAPAAGRVFVTTFHGLGLRILREQADRAGLTPGFRIADETERLALLREAFGRDSGKLAALDRRIAMGETGDPELAGALARYRAGKRARNLVDLDDLITLPVGLLENDPVLREEYRARWTDVSVDEYQDVDGWQYRLLRQLCPPDGRLCAIGDPDQAIYRFRGADVGYFLRFREDFPTAKVVQLTRNYRSTPVILTAATQAVAPGTLVPGRRLVPAADVPGAERIALHTAADERAEAGFVAASIDTLLGGSSFLAFDRGAVASTAEAVHSLAEIAVLYRTDAQARAVVEALDAAGIPYQKRSHHRLADQPGVREILAALPAGTLVPRPVLSVLRNAAQTAMDAAGGLPLAGPQLGDIGADAWTDTAAGHRSGSTAVTDVEAPGPVERVEAIRAALELLTPLAERSGTDLDRFRAEIPLGAEVDLLDPRADRVSLLTLHAAKGLEFPVVFVIGCEDGILPLRFPGVTGAEADAELAEERRLFFVGVTRARNTLVLSGARRRFLRGENRQLPPSRFLGDLDPALLDAESTAPAKPRTVQLRLL